MIGTNISKNMTLMSRAASMRVVIVGGGSDGRHLDCELKYEHEGPDHSRVVSKSGCFDLPVLICHLQLEVEPDY